MELGRSLVRVVVFVALSEPIVVVFCATELGDAVLVKWFDVEGCRDDVWFSLVAELVGAEAGEPVEVASSS